MPVPCYPPSPTRTKKGTEGLNFDQLLSSVTVHSFPLVVRVIPRSAHQIALRPVGRYVFLVRPIGRYPNFDWLVMGKTGRLSAKQLPGSWRTHRRWGGGVRQCIGGCVSRDHHRARMAAAIGVRAVNHKVVKHDDGTGPDRKDSLPGPLAMWRQPHRVTARSIRCCHSDRKADHGDCRRGDGWVPSLR